MFTATAGVHADFDVDNKLIGLEVLDSMEVLGQRMEFEVVLPCF
jgi:hypothetical protein